MKTNMRFKFISLLSIAILVALDQYFKYWAIVNLSPIETRPVVQDIFHLTYLENPGAAFGSFAGEKTMLIGLTSAMLILLTIFLVITKLKNKVMLLSLSLVIAGGLGNLIDRVVRGIVVDYLHVIAIDFPIFNFADCCVVVGIFLFMICFIFVKEEKH